MTNRMEWKTEKRAVNQLKPWPHNPRQFSDEQKKNLAKSIERFNVVDPIVINTDNTVIGGHFRLAILKEKGVKEVDVRVPDRKLTGDEVGELNIRLNKNLGDWDFDKLSKIEKVKLKKIGFDDIELRLILGETIEKYDDQPEISVGDIKTKNECPKCGYKW